MPGQVVAVHRNPVHAVGKVTVDAVSLVVGLGVEGDTHAGVTVQHRSRVARDPAAPNRRQVHLVSAELHEELDAGGFAVGPGTIGENITTRGVDLLGLSTGTRLRLGPDAVLELTGLRNPCRQLDGLQPGLMAAVLDRDAAGRLIRRAGVMAVVVAGGTVRAGDVIAVQPATGPPRPLEPV